MGAAFRDQDELAGLRKEIRTLRASLEKPSD
jgi:hypothetical protein